MKKTEIPLEPEKFYHVYNRGNNGEIIFYNEENYKYFLRKFDKYLSNYLTVYAYCLIPNHFHFLIKVKVLPFEKVAPLISKQFRLFFTSYAMAINKQQNRYGSLFQKSFKRKEITSEEYLKELIVYIHNNPVHHRIVMNINNYKWNSYHKILNDKPSKLPKQEIIEWFDNSENFIFYHLYKADFEKIKNLIIE